MVKKKALEHSRESRVKLLAGDVANKNLSFQRKCSLLHLNRSTLYYRSVYREDPDHELMNQIDEVYTAWPFYGSRRIAVELSHRTGRPSNRKKIQRLMRLMGIEAIGPKPNLSKASHQNKVFPYLLRGKKIVRPNEVWSTDVTYVRLARGFAYLTAVIDWYSRYVISWKFSNTMDTSLCLDVLDSALNAQGAPEIFNTDQGSQYTSRAFVDQVIACGAKLSMDGRGRALDNVFVERLWRSVKYENIYPRGYETMCEAQAGLEDYFKFYNIKRRHQALNYRTPIEIYGCARKKS